MTGAHRNSASSGPLAMGAALALHCALALAVWRVEPRLFAPRERPVEVEVREPPPPPPDVQRPPPPPPEPPPPEPPRPKVVARRAEPREPAPPPTAPPPPNQTPPPEAPKNAPPVFGVTMSSVVAGDSSVAVPVGNTTMTKDRSVHPAAAVKPYAAPAAGQAFQPVPDVYVATRPRTIYEVNSADVYPPDAQRLGLEGKVKLSVGIDAKGTVVEVKVIEPAGHGFDEAALRALKKFRFSPALTSDGRAVPYRLTYSYVFESGS